MFRSGLQILRSSSGLWLDLKNDGAVLNEGCAVTFCFFEERKLLGRA